jgi:spermidine synthase
MSSHATVSEIMLADLTCGKLASYQHPRVLIGGLGLGFTLKRVLELVGRGAVVHVAELIPDVVAWNRELLRSLNGKLLADERVEVFVADVVDLIKRGTEEPYDAILLDVDNGPIGSAQGSNSRLYDRAGFDRLTRALTPSGKVAFWSACDDRAFVERLSRAGFQVETAEAKAHERAKRAAHRIFVAERRPPEAEGDAVLSRPSPTPRPGRAGGRQRRRD